MTFREFVNKADKTIIDMMLAEAIRVLVVQTPFRDGHPGEVWEWLHKQVGAWSDDNNYQ